MLIVDVQVHLSLENISPSNKIASVVIVHMQLSFNIANADFLKAATPTGRTSVTKSSEVFPPHLNSYLTSNRLQKMVGKWSAPSTIQELLIAFVYLHKSHIRRKMEHCCHIRGWAEKFKR